MSGATAKQQDFLLNLGATDEQIAELADVAAASALIDALLAKQPPKEQKSMEGPASEKQVALLRDLGVDEQIIPLDSKQQASDMISQLLDKKKAKADEPIQDVPADTTGLTDKPHGDDDSPPF